MTARAVGPVEQHIAGHRAAETFLTMLITGACPRGALYPIGGSDVEF